MTGSEVCEGCCEVIYDRFVMRVGNSPWHEDCLFCSECHAPLTNTCYYKEGRLLCRGDYERRFGVKCGRCGQCLNPHDLVMRTRYSIYHIACFVCTVCGQNLNRGDQYVVRADQLVCMSDYEKECFMVQGFSSTSSANPGSSQSEFVQDGQQGLSLVFCMLMLHCLSKNTLDPSSITQSLVARCWPRGFCGPLEPVLTIFFIGITLLFEQKYWVDDGSVCI